MEARPTQIFSGEARASTGAVEHFAPSAGAGESIEDLVALLSRPSVFDGDGRPLTADERVLL
jgi:hypothetical protein